MRTFWFIYLKYAVWWIIGAAAASLISLAHAQSEHDSKVEAFLASIADLKPFLSDEEFADYEANLENLPAADRLGRLHALAFDYVLRYQYEDYERIAPRLRILADQSATLEIEYSNEIFQALIDLEASGDYDLASNRLRSLADKLTHNNDQKLMALISLAYSQSDARENALAAETLRETITLSRNMNLTLNQRIDVASLSEYVLSGVGDHHGAFDALVSLPDLYTELGLPVDQIWALSKLTEYYLSVGEFEKAIAPNQEAIALAIEQGKPLEMLHQYHYCGSIFRELERYAQAADCLLNAEKYIHLIEEREVWWLQTITDTLIQAKRLDEARAYFARLEEKVAAGEDLDKRKKWTQEIRAKLLHAEGSYEEAFILLSDYSDAQQEELIERNEANAEQLRLLLSEEADYLRQNESLNRQIIVRQRWIVQLIAGAAVIALLATVLLLRNRRALIRSALRNKELLSQTQDLAARLGDEVKRNDHLARHDELTGLLNRRGFFEHLPNVIADADKLNQNVVFGVLDLDRFKSVNDVYGHAVGDQLLQEVASRLTSLLGDGAIVGRLGGDEFAVILPNGTNEEDAQKIGREITASLSQKAYFDGVMLRPRASVGFAVYPNMAQDCSELYANADIALYAAKEKRRGSISFFDAELKKKSTRNSQIEHALNAADEAQFYMEYQPICEANGETPVAVEALARWHHPEFGAVSPVEFIPLAERNGAMVRLSKVFLSKALEDAKLWSNEVRLSVNLSAIDLSSLEHARDLRDIILGSGIDPANLTLELTETAVIKDHALTNSAMSLFREIGVHIALDDFGTGHASLVHLRHLPVDQLKIDRALTEEIEHDYATRRIVKTIIDMCEVLKLSCVVEGVSDENKLRILRRLGAKWVQGFHIAKPMSAANIGKLLLAARTVGKLGEQPAFTSNNQSWS